MPSTVFGKASPRRRQARRFAQSCLAKLKTKSPMTCQAEKKRIAIGSEKKSGAIRLTSHRPTAKSRPAVRITRSGRNSRTRQTEAMAIRHGPGTSMASSGRRCRKSSKMSRLALRTQASGSLSARGRRVRAVCNGSSSVAKARNALTRSWGWSRPRATA